MVKIIVGILIYLLLGVSFAVDFFYAAYKEKVEHEGMRVGEFFVLTILVGLIWPICIMMFAIMHIRGEI